jgi:glycosyltransferase involved in cell wall biosynthesis
MRILFVNSHGADPAYGGAERYVGDLAVGMRERGHESVILSAFPPRADAGVPTRVLHSADWRESSTRRIANHVNDVIAAPSAKLESAVTELRPDVVHTNNLPGIGTGIWEVARRNGRPLVHTLHDYYLLCPRTTLMRRDGTPCRPSPMLCGTRTRRLLRWSKAVDQVVAGSDHLLGAHSEMFAAASRRVIRLPLAPLAGGPAPAPERLATIGFIGTLAATKGVRLLLEAAAPLAALGVRVRIAGSGPLEAEVAAAPVDYLGRVADQAKEEFLASCDVGMVPSLWGEPSGPPYVVQEWLAAGRPVLATRRGALAEVVDEPGVSGFEPRVDELVEAIKGMRDDWEATVRSVPVVDGDSGLGAWLDEYEAIYESRLDARRVRTGA